MYRFSSRFEEDIPAVVSFTYQEPENDPRHFGYLWVVRGPTALQSMFVSRVSFLCCCCCCPASSDVLQVVLNVYTVSR